MGGHHANRASETPTVEVSRPRTNAKLIKIHKVVLQKFAPVFLSREAVDLIHEASLQVFGGANDTRDEKALESALAQPVHEHFYRQADLFQITAAYAFHLAENQPYIDGNQTNLPAKRVELSG